MALTTNPRTDWALHSVRRPDNVVELRPSGFLDHRTAPALTARLRALVIAALLDALGGRLVLVHADDVLLRLLGNTPHRRAA